MYSKNRAFRKLYVYMLLHVHCTNTISKECTFKDARLSWHSFASTTNKYILRIASFASQRAVSTFNLQALSLQRLHLYLFWSHAPPNGPIFTTFDPRSPKLVSFLLLSCSLSLCFSLRLLFAQFRLFSTRSTLYNLNIGVTCHVVICNAFSLFNYSIYL